MNIQNTHKKSIIIFFAKKVSPVQPSTQPRCPRPASGPGAPTRWTSHRRGSSSPRSRASRIPSSRASRRPSTCHLITNRSHNSSIHFYIYIYICHLRSRKSHPGLLSGFPRRRHGPGRLAAGRRLTSPSPPCLTVITYWYERRGLTFFYRKFT